MIDCRNRVRCRQRDDFLSPVDEDSEDEISPDTTPRGTQIAAAAVTAQPSAETGDSPQPSCLGPNQAFRPSNGLVLIAARRPFLVRSARITPIISA